MGAWWLPVGAGARLGERRSGRVPGWVSAGRAGARVGSNAGPGGCRAGAPSSLTKKQAAIK